MASFRKKAELKGKQVFLPGIGLVRDGSVYEGNFHQFCPTFLELVPQGQMPPEVLPVRLPIQDVIPSIPPVAPSLEKNLKATLNKVEPEIKEAPEVKVALEVAAPRKEAEHVEESHTEEDKSDSKALAEQALRRKGNVKKGE